MKSKKATKGVAPTSSVGLDTWIDPQALSLEQLREACANSNIGIDPGASKQRLIGALCELGYVTVLRNDNSGEFRMMKS